jgi:hypothetical protein
MTVKIKMREHTYCTKLITFSISQISLYPEGEKNFFLSLPFSSELLIECVSKGITLCKIKRKTHLFS